jgi:hypothetical protein
MSLTQPNSHHESVRYLREVMAEKEDKLKNSGNVPNDESGVDIMSMTL